LATRSGAPGGTDVTFSDGATEDGELDTEADDVDVPPVAGGLPWCEFATVAMPTVAPATATTLSAARAGAQRLLPKENLRRGRGSRPRLDPRDSLATR
jgi:hypothetical protein